LETSKSSASLEERIKFGIREAQEKRKNYLEGEKDDNCYSKSHRVLLPCFKVDLEKNERQREKNLTFTWETKRGGREGINSKSDEKKPSKKRKNGEHSNKKRGKEEPSYRGSTDTKTLRGTYCYRKA